MMYVLAHEHMRACPPLNTRATYAIGNALRYLNTRATCVATYAIGNTLRYHFVATYNAATVVMILSSQ